MNRKILFFVESLFELGPLGQLKPILHGLHDNDYEVHVATTSKLNDSSRVFFGPHVHLHSVFASNRRLQQWLQLRRLVLKLDPQIVHAWGHRCHNRMLLATSGHKSSLILTFLETPEAAPWLRMYGENFLRRGWFRHSRSIQFVASHHCIQTELLEAGCTGSVAVIPNAIPSQRFDCHSSRRRLLKLIGQTSDNVYLAGTVARYDPGYRLKDLVWAIDLLCCVRKDIHLIVFGTGNEDDRRALCRFISRTQSTDNVHLIPTDDVQESDIAGLNFYWNSQLQEPNPSAMLSAMAQSIPVVSVLGTETKDVILALRSALGTNYGARDEFARWTKYLIEQPDSASQIARQGREFVENLFPTQKAINEYLKLYASAC